MIEALDMKEHSIVVVDKTPTIAFLSSSTEQPYKIVDLESPVGSADAHAATVHFVCAKSVVLEVMRMLSGSKRC